MRCLSTVRVKGTREPTEAAEGSGGVANPTPGARPSGLGPQARGIAATKSISISTVAQSCGVKRGADQARLLKTGKEAAIARHLSGRIGKGQASQVPLKKVSGSGIQACKVAASSFTPSQERSGEGMAEVGRNRPLRISMKQVEVAYYGVVSRKV